MGRLHALVGAHPRTVAVLFARADSNYKLLPDTEVYDMERDARTYDGPWPVVAHPPCRAWGRLRTFAQPRPDEQYYMQAIDRAAQDIDHLERQASGLQINLDYV